MFSNSFMRLFLIVMFSSFTKTLSKNFSIIELNSLKIKEELLISKEEKKLYNFLTKLAKSNKISSELNYNKIQSDQFNEFNSLIEKFFDNVLVNDENLQIKNNRIKLLDSIKLNFEMKCKFHLLKI